jgi:hypothetical protein
MWHDVHGEVIVTVESEWHNTFFLIVSNGRTTISQCTHNSLILMKRILLMTSKIVERGRIGTNLFNLPGYVVMHRCYRNVVIRLGQWGRCCAGYIWYSVLSDASSSTRGQYGNGSNSWFNIRCSGVAGLQWRHSRRLSTVLRQVGVSYIVTFWDEKLSQNWI